MSGSSDKERPYLALTLGTLVIVGGGIIALVYGPRALLTALPFLLFGALMIAALWFLVTAVGRWRDRSEREYHAAAARHIASKAAKEDEAGGSDDPGR